MIALRELLFLIKCILLEFLGIQRGKSLNKGLVCAMTHRGVGGGIREMGIDTKKTWSGAPREIIIYLGKQVHITC